MNKQVEALELFSKYLMTKQEYVTEQEWRYMVKCCRLALVQAKKQDFIITRLIKLHKDD